MKVPAILAGLKRQQKSHGDNIVHAVEEIKANRAISVNAEGIVHQHKMWMEVNRQIECVETALAQLQNGILEESP